MPITFTSLTSNNFIANASVTIYNNTGEGYNIYNNIIVNGQNVGISTIFSDYSSSIGVGFTNMSVNYGGSLNAGQNTIATGIMVDGGDYKFINGCMNLITGLL